MNNSGNFSQFEHPDAEETLRLLAKLPPPEGLTDRVHHKLRTHAAQPRRSAQTTWIKWTSLPRLQFAGAAVILAAAAGGALTLYHPYRNQPGSPIVPPVHGSSPAGGFGSAHSIHVPPTLAPLHVPPAPKKKPGLNAPASKADSQSVARSESKPRTTPVQHDASPALTPLPATPTPPR